MVVSHQSAAATRTYSWAAEVDKGNSSVAIKTVINRENLVFIGALLITIYLTIFGMGQNLPYQ